MLKNGFVLLILFFNLGLFAQKKINLTGRVLDKKSNLALQSATIYLENSKDSTIIDFAISDKNGFFDLKTRKIIKPILLKISYLGYKSFQKEISDVLENKDLGILFLVETNNVLDEVVIKNDIPPIRIKKDTLEYNIKSFKIRKDYNVEKMLKQLPGINIDTNGKITVNGKVVNKILVNGKPFFDEDGKIALQNLPSGIIDKVQVVDTKTKAEEFSGDIASSDNKTINLTIDANKEKGKFGNATVGVGNNNSNETNLFFNYFNGDRRISLIQSSNNIRTNNNLILKNSSEAANDFEDLLKNNEIKSLNNTIGLNYQDKLSKNINIFGNYTFNNSGNTANSRFTKTNLLPSGNRITDVSESNESKSDEHALNYNLEFVIDTTSTLNFATRFSRSKSKSSTLSYELTKDNNNSVLNNSRSDNFSTNDQTTVGNNLGYNKKLKSKRILSINYDSDLTFNQVRNVANSENQFQDILLNFDRKQKSLDQKSAVKNRLDASYSFTILDSLRMNFSSEMQANFNKNSLKTFDFNPLNNSYSLFNNLQSFDFQSQLLTSKLAFGFNLNKEKINIGLQIGSQFIAFNNYGFYDEKPSFVNKNYVYPKLNLNANYTISKNKSVSLNYDFDISLPTSEQLIPIENLSNPINITVGNEFLKPEKNHSFYMNYNFFEDENFFSVNVNSAFKKDNIVQSKVFDANSKSITTYQNVANSKSVFGGISWNKNFKFEKLKLSYNTGLSSGLSQNLGLTNNEIFTSNALSVSPSVGLTLVFGEILTISPTYEINFSSTKYKNSVLEKFDNSQHNLRLAVACFVPKNFTIETDFSFTTNANTAPGFKNEMYMWNSSVNYSFWKDRFSAKLRVFDILNHNQNTQREINSTSIIDRGNSTISRYGIISLSYKLEQFKTEKSE